MPFSIAGPSGPALPSLDGINKASDSISSGQRANYQNNAAEAAITGRLDTALGESTIVIRNATNQISSLQKADQTLGQATELVERIQALRVQEGSGALSKSDKDIINRQQQSLIKDTTNLLDDANFNDQALFSESGINIESLKAKLDSLRSSGVTNESLDNIQAEISNARSEIGAEQNVLSSSIGSLEGELQSTKESRSSLSDTDFANEFANLIQQEILFEANVKVFNHRLLAEESLLNLLTG
ncbi:MAG: hypothetical protein JKY88_14705 [Pseudomonadales bacterium]|nr:hypothetical protein [Pseudomonadales bacterium]